MKDPNLCFRFASYDRVIITRYDNSPEHKIPVGEFWLIELPINEIWQLRYSDEKKQWPLPGVIRAAFNEFLDGLNERREMEKEKWDE